MGTQKYYRPKISIARLQALEVAATRRGVPVSSVLGEAIDRYTGGCKRGIGKTTDNRLAARQVLGQCVCDLSRYDRLIAEVLSQFKKTSNVWSLPDAEALDNLEALLECVLTANTALRYSAYAVLNNFECKKTGGNTDAQ